MKTFNVECVNTVCRQVLISTDACIRHNCDAAARFISVGCGSVSTAAITDGAVKGMQGSPLVTHFVSNVVNGERVTDRIWEPGHALGLRTATRPTNSSDSAAARAENVADVIVCRADPRVDCGLILTQHCRAVAVRVGIICGRAGSAAVTAVTRVRSEEHTSE